MYNNGYMNPAMGYGMNMGGQQMYGQQMGVQPGYGAVQPGGYGGGALNTGYGPARSGGGRGAGRGAGGYTGAVGGGGAPRQGETFTQGKIFLGGLDNATTKENLLAYCSEWGEVTDHVLMEGRGFGFVTYADPANAAQFLETREHVIDGKKVEAKPAVPKSGQQGNRKLFVGGTGEIEDVEFKQYFDQFGEIEDCVVLRKQDGGSRGFGFVTYRDDASVDKVLQMQHNINGRMVEIKRAVKKEEMGPVGGGYGGGGGAGAYAAGAGGPLRNGKQPDWICPEPNCSNKNFGWREVCNRCQAPKPDHLKPQGFGRGGGYNQGGFGGGVPMQGYGMGGMGMGGMGVMPQMGMGGMGMGGYGMGMPQAGMAGGMAGGMGYGAAQGGGFGGQPNGYGRAAGGGRGGQQRYRPY